MNDPLITIAHVREAGMCVRGAKQWFALHGMDFQQFLTKGCRLSDAEKIDDAFARRLVEIVRDEG